MSELKSYHGCEIVECQMSFHSCICLEPSEQSKEQSDTTSAPLICSNFGITCRAFLRSSFKLLMYSSRHFQTSLTEYRYEAYKITKYISIYLCKNSRTSSIYSSKDGNMFLG